MPYLPSSRPPYVALQVSSAGADRSGQPRPTDSSQPRARALARSTAGELQLVLADNGWLGGKSCGYRRVHGRLREADMDRTVFESVEREIDDEVRARFPGDVIKQAVLLHYGDDPEIEPGELWVRVLLRADRPEEYEQIVSAFARDHLAAMEEFTRYLAETLREIRLVEFTFPDNPVTSGGHGPRRSWLVGQRVTDLREAARVDARLGPANLETVDTLIMAGIADDRADAIGWVLAGFRQQPEYEQLREWVAETVLSGSRGIAGHVDLGELSVVGCGSGVRSIRAFAGPNPARW